MNTVKQSIELLLVDLDSWNNPPPLPSKVFLPKSYVGAVEGQKTLNQLRKKEKKSEKNILGFEFSSSSCKQGEAEKLT